MHEVLTDKKVLFFDVGYTISFPVSGDWFFTNKFYELAGERLEQFTPDRIREATEAGYVYLARHHRLETEEEEADQFFHFYRIVSDRLRMGLTDEEAWAVALDRTYNMENYGVYPDARKVLQTLGKTHRLGVISDTHPSIEHQLQSLGVRSFFSFVTYSFTLGVRKPHPAMYEDALRKAGCKPKDAVFIDDIPGNLAGAEALGITPILIAANPVSDVETPYLKIHALSELIEG